MLTERQRRILKAIIDVYVETAEPVGSKILAQRLDLGVSPATLRNEMAELIARGYLEQPHTSAGRVPTHKGYRLYVNELMNDYALTREDTSRLHEALRLKIAEYDKLIDEAGKAISHLTNYASITARPKLGVAETIRHIDVVRCGESAFVIVVVTGRGAVRNRMIQTTANVSDTELDRLRSALSIVLTGLEPGGITLTHIRRLETVASESCVDLLGQTVAFLREIGEASGEMEVRFAGAGNLLGYPEYRDVDKARELLSFLSGAPPTDWLSAAGNLPVVYRIGEENAAAPLKDASVVVAKCPLGNGCTGYIGIVGPTRMNYPQLAARLEYFAKGLSALLSGSQTGHVVQTDRQTPSAGAGTDGRNESR